MIFILVPLEGVKLDLAVHAARRISRVAHGLGLWPVCPLLFHLTYMSPGELSMEQNKLFMRWLRRSEKIWLQFPDEDLELLDTLSYDILEENRRLEERRTVYQVHSAGEEFYPIPMTQEEIRDLLQINLTSGLAKGCV